MRGIRFAWDSLGIAALLLAVVLLIRGGLSNAVPPADPAHHPYAGLPWFAAYQRELEESLRMQWSSYVYWQRHPFDGRYIGVDSLGYRRTTQANLVPATREVWIFGGSTMWGTWQRDSMTIPSQLARELARLGLRDVTVRNFGETGYVAGQELTRLMLELIRGARPDAVAFADGIPELVSTAENGRCGLPQNENRRRIEFAIGRVLTQRSLRDALELGRVVRQHVTGESHQVPALRSKQDERTVDLVPLERASLRCYAATMQMIESLATSYGFAAYYFWQPSAVTSTRALTAFELVAVDTLSMSGMHPYVRALSRLAARNVDSLLGPVAPGRFFNLSHVFDGEPGPIFLDYIGHITEYGAGRIAQAMAIPIARALQHAGTHGPARTDSTGTAGLER